MTVIFAFYVSTGTFWWRKCLNNFSFSHFFSSGKLFGFLAISLSAGLPKMQSTWQETFSHELFSFRKLVVCIIIFRVWVEDSWIFVRFLAECQNCIPRVHRNIPRKRLFCRIKINFVFGFWATKMDCEKPFGMLVRTASYASRGTFGATFFEYVRSRLIIFRCWTNNFLSPMESFWHGCESGILRDQRTVMGMVCFNVKEPILFDNLRPWAE